MNRLPWVWTGLIGLLSLVPLMLGDYLEKGLAEMAETLGGLLLPVLFTALGSVIATRQPGNRISWILFVVGFSILLDLVAQSVITSQPASPSFWDYLALAVANVAWVGIFFPIFLLLYLFPTGKFLTPRWRWAWWLATFMVIFFVFISFFIEEWSHPDETWAITNPIGFIPVDFFEGPVSTVWIIGLLALVLGGLASLVVRYRRSSMIERIQIKWFLYAAVVFAAGYAAAAIFQIWASGFFLSVLFIILLAMIPVSITVAITRYRLFEIDRIISRTAAYTVVAAVLALVFIASVTLTQQLLPVESQFGVVVSTLVVAALFNPLRLRVQTAVDRRFNRSRYDAQQVVAEFSNRLSNQTDMDQLAEDLAVVVTETMQPSSVGVWVRAQK